MTNIVELGTKQTAIERICLMLDNKEITGAKLARELGISTSTLSQVKNGTYAADTAAIEEKLLSWLDMRAQKAVVTDPGFVMTETARQIQADISFANATNSIVVIHGASGVGKTKAAANYQRHNPNVWMITASPSRATMTECLYELAMALGMEQAPRLRGPLARAIRRRLAGTEGLLIVDEADHISYDTLEELRILAEEAEIGMVLIGNSKVYTQLTGGSRSEDFARLFSRIAKKRALTKTKREDVRAVARAWDISGDDELATMIQIAERPGGLRLLNKTLRLSLTAANGEPINNALLRRAFKELEGE